MYILAIKINHFPFVPKIIKHQYNNCRFISIMYPLNIIYKNLWVNFNRKCSEKFTCWAENVSKQKQLEYNLRNLEETLSPEISGQFRNSSLRA